MQTHAHHWTLPADPSSLLVLTNGYQSWSESELRPLTDTPLRATLPWMIDQGHDPVFPPSGQAGVWRSHGLIALIRPDGGGWVGCALDLSRSFAHWEARAAADRVEVTCTVEGPDVDVAWEETGDVRDAVERLAGDLGAAMGARTPAPLRVWCSWYSYYRDVTFDDMLDNARLAREHHLPFDVFQLDDGFQADLGDWTEPSPHFGRHARDLPAELHALGFRAGLWIAPFLVGPGSTLFADHPEWLLHGEDGQPALFGNNWGGAYAALDTTHPDVRTWLRDLASTIRAWGYDYLKIDFLYGAALPGIRHDAQVSRAEAFRLGLQAIRDGFGDGFILGCGAPLTASIGVVDAMRTGPDVTPYWDDEARRVLLGDGAAPSARSAIHTVLARWYQHLWYQNDPDVMIARRERSLLTDDERSALLGLLDVTGGLRASSDPIAMLDDRGLDLLRASLELSTPDRPLSLTDRHGPTATQFTRGTFNLLDTVVAGQAPHSFRASAAGAVADSSGRVAAGSP
ncbi:MULTISPECIES: glycoside hydrolase family 36 protein [Deinococcus]|uniref:Glycoside hydrolase family 36 protein n=1 Tax=Deinococcus rufus TaxID=2136097 RepID=A0ABV7Z9B6_9DEIO|nr:glycoside hydrolase family 36 protein [Deinococcus sp. AB2017081]WQE97366.1 glycoside hydrolase family 36 protein [Deinococcus sp. AB2017081]